MPVSLSELQKLYVAYFGRPADPDGIAYYTNKPGITIWDVAAAFGHSPESQALYGPAANVAMIGAIYQNLFNRDAEPAGISYWLGEISNGHLTAGGVALAILLGAQNEDKACVANKLTVADEFTAALDTPAEMIGYVGDAAAASARAFLHCVGADPATVVPWPGPRAFAGPIRAVIGADIATLVNSGKLLAEGRVDFIGTGAEVTGLAWTDDGDDILTIVSTAAGATTDLSSWIGIARGEITVGVGNQTLIGLRAATAIVDAAAMMNGDVLTLTGKVANGYVSTDRGDVTSTLTGNVVLVGGLGDNVLIAGGGNDTINGGRGADVMTGGAGNNTFVFAAGDSASAGAFDSITDYTSGADKIDCGATNIVQFATVTAAAAGTAGVNVGGDVTFNAADNTLTLETAAVANAMGTAAAGNAVVFGLDADSYVYITDGTAGVGANDVLIKLVGISNSGTTDQLTITAGDITGLA